MSFLQKHSFKIAIFALCLAMGIYLYLFKYSEPAVDLSMKNAAPNYTLTDLDGKQVQLSDSKGKVRVIYFYFANCPDICPPTTYLMSELQNELKKDGTFAKKVQFVSISFDPTRDTPAKIREFIAKIPNDIDSSGWQFLRGQSEAEVKQLMKDFGLGLVKDESSNTFMHTDTIVFVDGKGNVRRYETGSIDEKTTVAQLQRVVDALLDE